MDTFRVSDLRSLTATHQGPCVSMFLPTHVAGRDERQDGLRLKNLVAQAERGLVEHQLRSAEARKLLTRVRDLPKDLDFWSRRSRGLAVYLAQDFFASFRVPLELRESVLVNQRFQVKPLLPMLTSDDRFYVLALSQHRVRLLEGRQFEIHEVPVAGMPASLEDALNLDRFQRAPQVHSAMRGDHGKQAAVFHGQGAERDVAKDDLARFFRIVDAALHEVLRDDHAPLFLAGVQYLLPIFRDVSSYPQIADEALPGNPEHLSGRQLHTRTWPLMVRRIDALREAAAERYRELSGTGKASSSIRRIVPTACQGQIESLFVDRGSHQWGTFDATTGDVQLRAAPGPDTDDLLDFAATQTALNRGQVFAVDSDEMPAHAVAAVFRY